MPCFKNHTSTQENERIIMCELLKKKPQTTDNMNFWDDSCWLLNY